MITYVNSKEAKLFEMAAADLGMASLDLDQYLANLSALKAISPKYVRLPLYENGHEDEEIFEIDANARAIKVPASFNKNGVGVVSDELAETVWFKINRYFDIKDFGKAAGVVGDELKDGNLHILIQWEAPDGTKGASWAYAIDADTDPDYIYFGWALTADHLTAKAGAIKFAVRILEYDVQAQKIGYSFSTQSASVNVKAGLSFDVMEENIQIESVADKIAHRLMDGQIANCPVFAEDGDLPAYILNLEGTPAQAVLRVSASAPEGDEDYDAMAYKWYKKGANDVEFAQIEGEYKPALTVTSSGQYYVVVFGMKEIVDNKEFVYYPAEGEEGEDDYVAERVEEENFKYHTSVASTKSQVCEIPAPIKLEITVEMAEKLLIETEAKLQLEISRQEINGDIVGDISVEMKRTSSAAKDLDLDNAVFTSVEMVEASTSEIPDDALTYSIINNNQISINMADAAEGYYKLSVKNALNGNEEETESAVICRAVLPAVAPAVSVKLLTESGADSTASEGSISRKNQIKATVNLSNALSDELQIQWYEVIDSQDPDDEAQDALIANANELIYKPEHAGAYYIVVTNVVEDTGASAKSNPITFVA